MHFISPNLAELSDIIKHSQQSYWDIPKVGIHGYNIASPLRPHTAKLFAVVYFAQVVKIWLLSMTPLALAGR